MYNTRDHAPAVDTQTKLLKVKIKSTLPPTMAMQYCQMVII